MRASAATIPDLDASAFDRRRLNAIERIWGPEARRRDLIQADSYSRLRRARRVGKGTIEEIERAVVAWGFEGVGGRDAPFETSREAMHRRRLDAALQEMGVKTLLEVLSQLCAERVAGARQALVRRLSQKRRVQHEQSVAYYTVVHEFLHRCAEGAPTRARRP
jgi:sugar phosphate isomerase/epimerase